MPLMAHKIRLYPTQAQAEFFKQNCGLARFAYNWALVRWKAQYECRKKHVAWLCEEHGIDIYAEDTPVTTRRKPSKKSRPEETQQPREPKRRRLPERELLKKLAAKGVTEPILPPAPSSYWAAKCWTRFVECYENDEIRPLSWVRALHSTAAERAIIYLGDAFKSFYDRLKKGDSKAGFPKFKRKDVNVSYTPVYQVAKTTYSENGEQKSIVEPRRIKLPKVGWVRTAEPLRFHGQVRRVVVSGKAGKWFASVLVDVEYKVSGNRRKKGRKWEAGPDQYSPLGENQASVGIDLGVKHALTFSDGSVVDSPKPLKRMLRRLRREQRKLSRRRDAALGKPPGKHDKAREEHAAKKREIRRDKYIQKLARRRQCSPEEVKAAHAAQDDQKRKRQLERAPDTRGRCRLFEARNYQKQRQKVAKMHYRVACQRENWLHEQTTSIIRKFGVICLENLNIRGMMSNEKLARSIADVGAFEFRRQLEYKAKFYGRDVRFADRWFPSSKLCSACGYKNDALTLSDREWACGGCGVVHDRDVNAATNLLRVCTGMYPEMRPELSEKAPVETEVRRSKINFRASSRSEKQESARHTAEPL